MTVMNIKDYYEKKKELEYLITYNERIHCPRVAEKWRRELRMLEQRYQAYKEEEDGRTTDA